MPTMEELVAQALQGRQDELRAIVQRAVDERLAALVDEMVVEELELRNGDRAAPEIVVPGTTIRPAADSGSKVCNRCGETKPLDAFVRHRGVCRDCRNAQRREGRARAQASACPCKRGWEGQAAHVLLLLVDAGILEPSRETSGSN